MSKLQPQGHIYICLCDSHRPVNPNIRQRPYRGRYVVNAKNEKQALQLLKKECPFGSLWVYYQEDNYRIQPEFGKVIKEC